MASTHVHFALQIRTAQSNLGLVSPEISDEISYAIIKNRENYKNIIFSAFFVVIICKSTESDDSTKLRFKLEVNNK